MYYVFTTELHMSPSEVDETPAHLVDWLMAIHSTVKKVEAEKSDPE